MKSLICGIDKAHMRSILNCFCEFRNAQRVGKITVIFLPEDLSEDGDCRSEIGTIQDGHVRIQDCIIVQIIDGRHIHAVIGELRNETAEEFNWRCQRNMVYYTIH